METRSKKQDRIRFGGTAALNRFLASRPDANFLQKQNILRDVEKDPMQHQATLDNMRDNRPSPELFKRSGRINNASNAAANSFHQRQESLNALIKVRPSPEQMKSKAALRSGHVRNNSSNIESFLENRPDRSELVQMNILEETQTEEPVAERKANKHSRGLSRFNGTNSQFSTPNRLGSDSSENASGNRKLSKLEQLLAQRSTPDRLISKNILVNKPFAKAHSVQMAQSKLKKHQRQESLSDLLSSRPTFTELTQLGIINEEDAPQVSVQEQQLKRIDEIEAAPFVLKKLALQSDLSTLTDNYESEDESIAQSNVMFSWGQGMHGQLGLDNSRNQGFPQLMRKLLRHNITEVCVGGKHSLAVDSTGQCFVWGDNAHGQLGLGDREQRVIPTSLHISKSPFCNTKVKKVAGGQVNSAAIGVNNRVYMFGFAEQGVLGNDKSNKDALFPTQVSALSDIEMETIDIGDHHVAAITQSGDLWTWGKGTQGQLGNGSSESSKVPVRNTMREFWESVKCGSDHCCALAYDHNTYAWGDNSWGQLGFGRDDSMNKPKLLNALRRKGVISLHCGRFHSLALCEDGSLYSTSIYKKGARSENEAAFYRMPPGRIFAGCAAGTHSSIGVAKSGILYVWNYSDENAGDHILKASTPNRLVTLQGMRVKSLFASYNHMSALVSVPQTDVDTMADEDENKRKVGEEEDTDTASSSLRMSTRTDDNTHSNSRHRRSSTIETIDSRLRAVAQDAD